MNQCAWRTQSLAAAREAKPYYGEGRRIHVLYSVVVSVGLSICPKITQTHHSCPVRPLFIFVFVLCRLLCISGRKETAQRWRRCQSSVRSRETAVLPPWQPTCPTVYVQNHYISLQSLFAPLKATASITQLSHLVNVKLSARYGAANRTKCYERRRHISENRQVAAEKLRKHKCRWFHTGGDKSASFWILTQF